MKQLRFVHSNSVQILSLTGQLNGIFRCIIIQYHRRIKLDQIQVTWWNSNDTIPFLHNHVSFFAIILFEMRSCQYYHPRKCINSEPTQVSLTFSLPKRRSKIWRKPYVCRFSSRMVEYIKHSTFVCPFYLPMQLPMTKLKALVAKLVTQRFFVNV